MQPSDDSITVRRYCTLPKLLDIVLNKRLALVRLDQFSDKLDGTVSVDAKEAAATHLEALSSQGFPKGMSQGDPVAKLDQATRKGTYASCWTARQDESDALWRLYGPPEESLCIETRYSTLRDALPEDVYLGMVQYRNNTHLGSDFSLTFAHVMSKRRAYDYEFEVRAVKLDGSIVCGEEDQNPIVSPVDIDPTALIARIIVSPYASSWFHDSTRLLLHRLGLTVDVDSSELT